MQHKTPWSPRRPHSTLASGLWSRPSGEGPRPSLWAALAALRPASPGQLALVGVGLWLAGALVHDGHGTCNLTRHECREMGKALTVPFVGPIMATAQTDSARETFGLFLLSGLQIDQERSVLAAYRGHGFRLMRRIRIEGWSTLVLQAVNIVPLSGSGGRPRPPRGSRRA